MLLRASSEVDDLSILEKRLSLIASQNSRTASRANDSCRCVCHSKLHYALAGFRAASLVNETRFSSTFRRRLAHNLHHTWHSRLNQIQGHSQIDYFVKKSHCVPSFLALRAPLTI